MPVFLLANLAAFNAAGLILFGAGMLGDWGWAGLAFSLGMLATGMLGRLRRSAGKSPSTATRRRHKTRHPVAEFSAEILHRELPEGLLGGQFHLLYQPVHAASRGNLVGVEALLRWQHPRYGLLAPDYFLAEADACGLLPELGRWILATACRQAARWHERDINLQMSINLSSSQFKSPDLLDCVHECLNRHALKPGHLVFEINEATAMQDADFTRLRIRQLHDMGVLLALDRFGTGYSSLAQLRHMPVDILKIDRSFVHGPGKDRGDAAIISTIVALGQSLDMQVVAHGIETPQQLAFVKSRGCTHLQGYFLGRPMPAEQLPLTGYLAAASASTPEALSSTRESGYFRPVAFTHVTQQEPVFHAANSGRTHS